MKKRYLLISAMFFLSVTSFGIGYNLPSLQLIRGDNGYVSINTDWKLVSVIKKEDQKYIMFFQDKRGKVIVAPLENSGSEGWEINEHATYSTH
jgi:hypothetical protein